MTIGIFDYLCAECGHFYEAIVLKASEERHCPRCNSAAVARQPVMQIAFRNSHRGRVVDMSSNSCPCGCAGARHGKRA